MTRITPQPGIMEIALYQGGASHVDGVADVVKLSSNENPFGPSPKAIAACQASAAGLHRYPSTDHSALRGAISEIYNLDIERIICGVGSDEIIHFLCQAYVGQGDEVIHTEHGFAMYRISTLAAGGTPVEVAEATRRVDVDAILAACTERTKLVFIANPNNPTATMIGLEDITRLAEGIPSQTLLVLDGAYAEYVPDYDGGAALVEERGNVVMTRTFSKLHGLGGLRVGWGYAPKAVINVLNRIRGPFNLSTTALETAEAAVRDTEYAAMCLAENAKWRSWLARELDKLGIPSDTSHANFILARFGSVSEANACDDHLKSQGILVRRVAGYKLPKCLRITVGDGPSCQRVVAAINALREQAA